MKRTDKRKPTRAERPQDAEPVQDTCRYCGKPGSKFATKRHEEICNV